MFEFHHSKWNGPEGLSSKVTFSEYEGNGAALPQSELTGVLCMVYT